MNEWLSAVKLIKNDHLWAVQITLLRFYQTFVLHTSLLKWYAWSGLNVGLFKVFGVENDRQPIQTCEETLARQGLIGHVLIVRDN